jgi:hypothetical protein
VRKIRRISPVTPGRASRAAIPRIRQGSYFPSVLEPRRRSEQALLAVVQQAYVCGVSARRVDQLVESLLLRISRSEVSRVYEAFGEHVASVMMWLLRPLDPAGPPGGSRRTVERPTRISVASAGTGFRPTRTHTMLRDVTRSRPTVVGPAIRGQRASDKMRLVW